MRAALDAFESGSPVRVDLDGANRIGFAGVLRAVLAPVPGRANAANEIDRRVVVFRQVDCDLAIADAVEWVDHGCGEFGLECGSLQGRRPQRRFIRATSAPIPKFASYCCTLACELRNQRSTRTY